MIGRDLFVQPHTINKAPSTQDLLNGLSIPKQL